MRLVILDTFDVGVCGKYAFEYISSVKLTLGLFFKLSESKLIAPFTGKMYLISLETLLATSSFIR